MPKKVTRSSLGDYVFQINPKDTRFEKKPVKILTFLVAVQFDWIHSFEKQTYNSVLVTKILYKIAVERKRLVFFVAYKKF